MKYLQLDTTEKRKFTGLIDPLEVDTVASAVWTATPALTIGAPANSGAQSTVLVSGFTLNVRHKLTVHVIGVSGQEYEESFSIKGIDK